MDQIEVWRRTLVPLADGDFVDADHAGRRRAGPTQLFPHVLFFEFFDGMPVEVQFVRNFLDRGLAATPITNYQVKCAV